MRKVVLLLSFTTGLLVLDGLSWWSSPKPSNRIIWSFALTRRYNQKNRNFERTPVLYAATDDAVYISTDAGNSWDRKSVGTAGNPFITMAANPQGILAAGTMNGVLYLSRDSGGSWLTLKISNYPISSIVTDALGFKLTVGTFGDGVFEVSTDSNRWEPRRAALTDPNVWCISDQLGRLPIAFTTGGAFQRFVYPEGYQQVSGPAYFTSCAAGGGHIYGRYQQHLLISKDDGHSSVRFPSLGDITLVAADEFADAVVMTERGAFWTTDGGDHWRPLTSQRRANASGIFAPPLNAQAGSLPDDVTSGVRGPTLLPPLHEPLNQGSSLNNTDVSVQGTDRVKEAEPIGSEATNSGEYGSSTPRRDDFDNSGGGPPPPPPPPMRPRVQIFVGLACDQGSGGGLQCKAAEVESYLRRVTLAKDIAEVVSKMVAENIVYDKNMLVTGAKEGIDKVIDRLVQEAIYAMEAEVEQRLQRMGAFLGNPPPLTAEVQAHVAHVKQIRDQAVRESRQGVASSSTSTRTSQVPNTSGTAFHQLSYSSVHGSGWWN